MAKNHIWRIIYNNRKKQYKKMRNNKTKETLKQIHGDCDVLKQGKNYLVIKFAYAEQYKSESNKEGKYILEKIKVNTTLIERKTKLSKI